MRVSGIITYTARALAFALPAGGLYLIPRLIWLRRHGRNKSRKREALLLLFVIYLAALIHITCIRGAAHLLDWWTLPHGLETVRLFPPLAEIIRQRLNGAWAVVYPVLGNILWFFPLGFLIAALWPRTGVLRLVLYSFLLSAAIECMQWMLVSGISDVDDVIFNVCGGLTGYACCKSNPV